MEINIPEAKMVVAVSGGVDSAVLLELIVRKCHNKEDIVVAHFDHGIRHGSELDAKFVCELASKYGVEFVSEREELGANASEALARKSRYDFLFRVMKENNADYLITAHHLDDRIETAIINIIRGTGYRGLVSLRNRRSILRPLLQIPKKDIIIFARDNKLLWRDDPSNKDQSYLRNYVRHTLIPRAESKDSFFKEKMSEIINSTESLAEEIDGILSRLEHQHLDRTDFIMLPYGLSREVMRFLVVTNGVRDVSEKTINRLVISAKTSQNGKIYDICHHLVMETKPDWIEINKRM